MNIGIDCHFAERQGTGNCTYTRNLVEALVRIDTKNQYYLYVSNPDYPYYKIFQGYDHVHLRPVKGHNPLIRIPRLGLQTFADKIDVLHMQYMAPFLHAGKLVTMVHDVSFLFFPQCFSSSEYWRLRALIPPNIAMADRVLTVSQSSKNDIVRYYHTLPEKVVVTYNGVSPIYRPMPDLDRSALLARFGIKGSFILFVGRINARKNITTLIQAFLELKRSRQIAHQLVIVGNKDFLPEQDRRAIAAAGQDEGVVFLSGVKDEDLPVLYNLADVFAYPSLYEGFGLPCLEALASGCLVVSSNTSSIPEVVGEAGLLVDPNSIEALVKALENVMIDEGLRNRLKAAGLEQARKFNWEKTAKDTLGVFQEVGGKSYEKK